MQNKSLDLLGSLIVAVHGIHMGYLQPPYSYCNYVFSLSDVRDLRHV